MSSNFLTALILNAEDSDKLAAFYKQILGLRLEKRKDGSDYSCMIGETHFAIHQLQEGKVLTSNVEFGIHVPKLDEFVKGLITKGVEIADPIKDYPWARSAQVKDPQGNLIYLMQLPESSLKELKARRARE